MSQRCTEHCTITLINTDYLSASVIDHRIILQINPSHVNYYDASHLSLLRGNAKISKSYQTLKNKKQLNFY